MWLTCPLFEGHFGFNPFYYEVISLSQEQPKKTSLISEDLEIDGSLHCLGSVVVQGTVYGNARGRLVTIGNTGQVFGEVEADDIVIEGTVKGPVLGVKLLISSSAAVVGNIVYRIIEVEFGATITGYLTRTHPKNALSHQSSVEE